MNLLHNIRGIWTEINMNSPLNFSPGVSHIGWNLIISFYRKHDLGNKDLFKTLIDVFMKYLCVHCVVK